ncbi:MAG: hypothetical protein ACYDAO_08605 [Thermoplasmataceae archaeon]
MEYTTIKITKSNRERLFLFASKIQAETGKRITLDQALDILLGALSVNKDKINSAINRINGTDLLGELQRGRNEDNRI